MAAYPGNSNRTPRTQQQFPVPKLDDRIIIYGDGIVFGGAPSAPNVAPLNRLAGGQRQPTQQNNSYTGLPSMPMNNAVPPQRMQQQPQTWQQQLPPPQQQHQQQQTPHRQQHQQQHQQQQQPFTDSHRNHSTLHNGLNELTSNSQRQQLKSVQQPVLQSLQQQLQEQQQQQQLQQQQLQQLQQQQQQHLEQQARQQQLQQAYNYWPFGGVGQAHNMNGGFGFNQPHAWPGYSVVNPINPNLTYTFGMD